MKNFIVRSISGIILAAILIGAILWSELSKAIIFSIIGLFAMKEIFSLVNHSGKVRLFAGGAFTIALFAILLFTYQYSSLMALPVFVLLILIRLTVEIYRKEWSSILAVGSEISVLLYIMIPTLLLFDIESESVILILCLVWGNDVGAYLFGVLFGKHKLFKRVSPKKSWEGFWGGFTVTIAISVLAAYYYFDASIIQYAVIGGFVSVASVYGDLFESLIKREMHVKDSGSVIPGHGGIWDRFDALFFAVPAYYIVNWVFMII